jgi:hypothetical protein
MPQLLYDYVVWGSYHERAPFCGDYQKKFGRKPYVGPIAQFRWAEAPKLSQEDHDETRHRRKVFQEFVESIFDPETIMLTPFKFGEPEPRDMYRDA